jgi:hypothetical protein
MDRQRQAWETSREPFCDQSNSATPCRYGLGSPPNMGTAQMPISVPAPLGLRTQKVTREPSGEKPRFRIDGLTSCPKEACVRLWNSPEPTWVSHTSTCPARSERNATKRPSLDSAALCCSPPKSVRACTRAFAIGLLQNTSAFRIQRPTAISSISAAASTGQMKRQRTPGCNVSGSCNGAAAPGALGLSSCSALTLRERVHPSNSARDAYTEPRLSCRCRCTGIPSRFSHRCTVVTSRFK